MTAPIISFWIPKYQLVLETNTSDYALAAILSIVPPDDGEIHPNTFHSQTFSVLELNYDVHDKELLAMFEAFKIWQHNLEGPTSLIDIVTDHKNLEYFAMTKLLTHRQVCWSEYLSQFKMLIHF
jgi:RNase H-like domain found in reverse transcriptase